MKFVLKQLLNIKVVIDFCYQQFCFCGRDSPHGFAFSGGGK